MSKVLGIIGAGHLGGQIAHMAVSTGQYTKVVFFDDVLTLSPYLNLIGRTDALLDAFSEKKFDELLIGIGYNHLPARKIFFERFTGIVKFGKLIHPTCWIDPRAEIGEGAILYPGCFVDANTRIGVNTLLNLSCTVAHDCEIGPHSFFAPRVAVAGFVNTGERCFFGINSTIVDSIAICDDVRTGAGTVINKSINEQGTYVGVPSKKIH